MRMRRTQEKQKRGQGQRKRKTRQKEEEKENKTLVRLKCGKAASMDGITAEMLKYGGDTVVEFRKMIIIKIKII